MKEEMKWLPDIERSCIWGPRSYLSTASSQCNLNAIHHPKSTKCIFSRFLCFSIFLAQEVEYDCYSYLFTVTPNRLLELTDYLDAYRYICAHEHDFWFVTSAKLQSFYINVLVPWFSTHKTEHFLTQLLFLRITMVFCYYNCVGK